ARVGLRPCTPDNPHLLKVATPAISRLPRTIDRFRSVPETNNPGKMGQLTYLDPLSTGRMRSGSGPILAICPPAATTCYLTVLWPSMRWPDTETADQDVLATHLVSPHVGKALHVPWGFSSLGTAPTP
ncbi:hypothetical protein M9458_013492, partial [Cirrhinus mrigala]